MDPLQPLVQHVPEVLHLRHPAQLGRDNHGRPWPVRVRGDPPRRFGSGQPALCRAVPKRNVFAGSIYDFHLRVAKCMSTLSKYIPSTDANTESTQWAPIWIKLGVTSALQHVGGIHSGCALSGAG